jgi:signal transduction histidine kinase
VARIPGDNGRVRDDGDWQTPASSGRRRALAFVRAAEPRPQVPRRAVSTDAAIAAVATVAALAATSGQSRDGSLLVPLLVIATAAPLAWRRTFPLAAFWTILAAIFVGNSTVSATLVTFCTLIVAAYSAVVHSRLRGAALISLPLATVLIMAKFPDSAPPLPARATPLLIFLPIMIVGNTVHLWTRRAGDSQAHLRQAQADHEAATKRVLELERTRIASELHDVVTHNVSVMVVQAGAARQVLTGSPDEARAALLAVESSGRAALTELRHLLGLFSPADDPEDGQAALRPQPGLGNVRSLVDRVAAAGLPVELQVSGTPQALPPGLDLTAFRVVQEALTNVLKHAGKPRTAVMVEYQADGLVIQVTDDGPPFPAVVRALDEDEAGMVSGARRGLLGLRERVTLYRGELDAGRRPDGGWLVRATIPVVPAVDPAESSRA